MQVIYEERPIEVPELIHVEAVTQVWCFLNFDLSGVAWLALLRLLSGSAEFLHRCQGLMYNS